MNKPATKAMGPRFAILARVSTKDQLTGYSLELQEKEAREYIQRAGGTVAKVYSAQESGTRNAEDRQVLQRLLADAERGLFDAVVIQETTRLSRNLGVMASVTEKLVDAGITLHDFGGPLQIDTPEGEFSVGIQALVGRLGARQSRKKSIQSREHVMKNGGIAAGRPPFGRRWDKELRRFEVIPERAAQLKRAYELIIRRGCSLLKAAAQLGIGPTSLRKGIAQGALTEVTQHLGGQEYKFPCPRLINARQQQWMEARIATNATVRPESTGEYLLQGLVRCAGCGGTMTGQTSTKDGVSHSIYRHPMPGKGVKLPEGCTWSAPVKLLDDDVLAVCADVVKDGAALRQAIKLATVRALLHDNNLGPFAAVLESDIGKAGRQLDKQLRVLEELGKGEARERQLAKIKQTESTLADLRAELASASARSATVVMPEGGADAIAAKLRALYFRRGAGAAVMLPFQRRQHFVRAIVGRTGRDSEEGVFVKMTRPEGGSKKNVMWRYRLAGCIAVADGLISPDADRTYAPDIRIREEVPANAIKHLALLAAGTPGIHHMKKRIKYSSDD